MCYSAMIADPAKGFAALNGYGIVFAFVYFLTEPTNQRTASFLPMLCQTNITRATEREGSDIVAAMMQLLLALGTPGLGLKPVPW